MTQFAISYLCLSKGTPREGVAIVEALSEYPARQLFWELEQLKNHSFGATSLGGANPQGHRVVFFGLVGVSAQEVPALKIYDAQSKTGDLLKTLLMPVLPGTRSINSAATPVGNMLFVTSRFNYEDGRRSRG